MANAPATEVEQNTAPIKPLNPSAVTFLEARNNTWSAVVDAGTTQERLLNSGLWSVAGERFRQFDIVHVIEASRAYYAQLLVVASGRGYCHMAILNWLPLEQTLTADGGQLPPGFKIEYRGPDTEARYCALRLADSVTIVSGMPSREECLAALLNHASLH